MKRLLAIAGLALAAAMPMTAPAAAQSQAWVSTNANLRAGPGTEYPVVMVVPAGSPVAVFGCVEGYGWCDIAFGDGRGFMAGSLLSYEYQDARRPVVDIGPQLALPIIAFTLGSYWDSHYRGRSFYRDRSRWEHRAYRPPPRYRPQPYHVSRPPPRPPVYRPDHRDYRPAYNERRDRRDYRRDERRDRRDYRRDERRDRREDAGRRFREQQRLQQVRPRVDRPPPITGGQTERDARRYNSQRRGPEPGE
jgi:uncharacterized protein YraI